MINSSARVSLSKVPPLKSQYINENDYIQPSNLNSEINVEDMFDEMMKQLQTKHVNQAVEPILKKVFKSEDSILWLYKSDQRILFSPTYAISITAEEGAISECLKTKKTLVITNISEYPVYSAETDGKLSKPNDTVIYIPFTQRASQTGAIVQITRSSSNPYSYYEIKAALHFQNKFKSFYEYLLTESSICNHAFQILTQGSLQYVTKNVTDNLCSFYQARRVEFFMLKTRSNQVLKIDTNLETMQTVDHKMLGIVRHVFLNDCVVNERYQKNHRNFNVQSDGNPDDSFLAVPVKLSQKRTWAIVLRGRVSPPYYSKQDEVTFSALAPFAAKSIASALVPHSIPPQYEGLEQRFKTLLDVAQQLSGALDIDSLLPMIMEKACKLLNAQRCSLFLVDRVNQELVTSFANGLNESIRIPINRGIVGHTATTGTINNVSNAYSDQRFDKTVDQRTGFRTRNILTVPIYNNRGEITGVTEIINKHGLREFSEDDIKMISAFNVFCGISLDNARLYSTSLSLGKKLRMFTDMSKTLKNSESTESTLNTIIENAKASISASNCIIYLYNQDEDSFSIIAESGIPCKYGTQFAHDAVKNGTQKIYNPEVIEKMTAATDQKELPLEDVSRQNSDIFDFDSDESISSTFLPKTPRASQALSRVATPPPLEKNTDFICCIPLVNSESSIIGVLQLVCQWKIVEEDLSLLDSFAVFTSLVIERQMLRGVAEFGRVEVEIKKWMTDEERTMIGTIPEKLRLSQELVDNIFSIEFDSPKWEGIGHFKVIYAIFDYFDFFNIYKITNEKLFTFLWTIRGLYKKVPYHNWRHAIDVTSFISYELKAGSLEKVFTKFEVFALVIACICHDVNHDGFSNLFNVKAETPLGILYKNQSVMETHHCAITISVLTRPECNLLSTLNDDEYVTIWNLIIQFILATDMARHFEILKKFNDIYDGGDFTMQHTEDRLMLMQMILKCGDISNVSRPFEQADRWCDVLCEEFFRQGDIEMAHGMAFTSELNDRATLDKPKSQIGFYTFICLPMFQAAGKAVPALDANTKQVLSNLEVWKKQNEENEKRRAEERVKAEAEAFASSNVAEAKPQ